MFPWITKPTSSRFHYPYRLEIDLKKCSFAEDLQDNPDGECQTHQAF
jgi:hypothetical protein